MSRFELDRPCPIGPTRSDFRRRDAVTRVSAWGRSLFARDELRGMSVQMLRDIGMGPTD